MRLRYGFTQDGNMLVAVIDGDGYALTMEYPRELHYSDEGRKVLAVNVWALRRDIRTTRTTRIRPTGGLNS